MPDAGAVGNNLGAQTYPIGSLLLHNDVSNNRNLHRFAEMDGLCIQQSITETTLKINNGGVQRYKNRECLKDYLSTIIGNNIKEVNRGFGFYKQNVQKGSDSIPVIKQIVAHNQQLTNANVGAAYAQNPNAG